MNTELYPYSHRDTDTDTDRRRQPPPPPTLPVVETRSEPDTDKKKLGAFFLGRMIFVSFTITFGFVVALAVFRRLQIPTDQNT